MPTVRTSPRGRPSTCRNQVAFLVCFNNECRELWWHARIHPYYARMDVKFYYGGKWRWDTGWFGYAYGGTVPWWQFPAVFPYL